MGKWNYPKHYNPKWEKEDLLKQWLQPTSEEDCNKGKPEAYCKVCQTHIRAHHNDLIVHSKSKKHQDNAKHLNRTHQPNLHDYGCTRICDKSKIADLKLALFIATHCSVTTIDHLGEILKVLGKGSQLQNTRLHRTKCSKLISAVIAPAFLTELMRDVGGRPYALIIDEATDVSACKFMGICIRFFCERRRTMVTDFLGIVQVTSCTGADLAEALRQYLQEIGLALGKLNVIGTDGAANMCGAHNSLFTHLKKDVPNLVLLKCTCHALHKSAEYAFKKMPAQLTYILSETHNWFAHSAKRLSEFSVYYKAARGKEPVKIQPLSTTRWLVWLPVSEVIIDQWYELRGFFGSKKDTDFKAETLAKLYADNNNFLYLNFLRTVLKGVHAINLSFEKTDADVTKLYMDLRILVRSLAGRIIEGAALARTEGPEMQDFDEVEALKACLKNAANHLPPDCANFGEAFKKLLPVLNVPEGEIAVVRQKCGEFVFTLCWQLLERMPSNITAISKLKYLTPAFALAKLGQPTFQDLPRTFVDLDVDLDDLDSQWLELGSLRLSDICPPTNNNGVEFDGNLAKLDSVYFWSCVLSLENASGNRPFEKLANFALKALTLPISNAVVERIFSIMSCVKTKYRNSLRLLMLEALLRIRVQLKINGQCCREFTPTKLMLDKFHSSMYEDFHLKDFAPASTSAVAEATAAEERDFEEDFELISMFDCDGDRFETYF